jgi:cytoskeleton protein RodZ
LRLAQDAAQSARAATPQPETVVSVSGAERSQQLRLPSAAAPSESAATPPPVQAPSSNTAASTTAITPQPLVTSKPVSVARVDTPAPQPVTAPERAAPEPQPDQAPAQAAPSRASQVRVTLNFDGDSWVEIYDSERRKLLYDMGRAGSRRTVTGDGPLQVFLGKASDVDVRVNGQPYTVERITSRGTARFYVDRTGR